MRRYPAKIRHGEDAVDNCQPHHETAPIKSRQKSLSIISIVRQDQGRKRAERLRRRAVARLGDDALALNGGAQVLGGELQLRNVRPVFFKALPRESSRFYAARGALLM